MDNAFDDIFEGNEAEESLMMDQIYDEVGLDMSSTVHSFLVAFAPATFS